MIQLLLGKFWLLCAGLVILLAVLLSLARVLLPYSDFYHDEIEDWLSRAIGQTVEIGGISAEWRGLGPHLELTDVGLIDSGTGLPLARFSRAGVELDLARTVVHAEPRIDRFVLSEINLVIERDSDGNLSVAGHDWSDRHDDMNDEDGRQDRLLSWILSQGRLALEAAEITWVDRHAGGGETRISTIVDVELRNDRNWHQLDGVVTLQEGFGERLAFAVDITGDPLGQDWQARTWLRGDGIEPAGWLHGHEFGGVRVEGGDAGVELWTRWRNGRLEVVEGSLSAAGIVLASETGNGRDPYTVDSLGGDFVWRTLAHDGWRVDVNGLVLERDGEMRPATGLALSRAQEETEAPVIYARFESLRIEDVTDLLLLGDAPDDRLREALTQLRPTGTVRDLAFDLHDLEGDRRLAAQATVADFSNRSWSGIPGTEALAGSVVFDESAGHVDLDIGVTRLDFDDLFRDPLPVDSLQGRISWRHGDDGWRVSAEQLYLTNEDLNLSAWGRLDLPTADEDRPFIALFAHFDARTVENTSRYLPIRIMPPNTVEWLDRSITGGSSPRGDLVLHGPLGAGGFPYTDGGGRFKVDFDLEEGTLEYHPEWPRLDQIAARITFEGPGMIIDAHDGRSFSTRITRALVEIPDLNGRPAVLEVDGKAEGLTVDALHYLRESPLAERFGAYADEADAMGLSNLDLRLTIPLDGSPAQVNGDLHFSDSVLSLLNDTIDITRINGRLNFTESGVSAEDIDADILGLPARVSVKPQLDDGTPGTLLEARGAADDRGIAALLNLAPLQHLEGAADWYARLRIPFAGDDEPGGALLSIESSLVGLAFRLPAPMAKSADAAAPLHVSIPLPRASGAPVSVAIGDMVRAVFTLDDEHRPDRGEFRFGAVDDLVLPEQPGLRISGDADEFQFEEWSGVFSAGEAGEDIEQGNITSLELRIGRARLFGRDFNDARISAVREDEIWRAEVSSDEMTGLLDVPLRDGMVWRMRLDHLHLAAIEEEDEGEGIVESDRVVDPRTLPPMRIESDSFSYGGVDFGSLSLVSSRRSAGLHLNKLLLSSPRMLIDARGDWVVAGDLQFSSFNIQFDTGDFGAALSNFGYAGTIRGGKGRTEIVARWHGPPTAFALNRLDGSMRMTIDDGRLLEVEPGAGRIFGLISLQALPRRLTLDFSDFFGRGFSFDRIAGSFTVKEGVATTEDLTMNGPAAKVEAKGRIDLANRRYDQIVDVYPNVTSGLPVAGIVAGGLGVGAAIFLAERIFRSDIDRMTKITYQVTGPWSDPVVQRLQESAQSGKR